MKIVLTILVATLLLSSCTRTRIVSLPDSSRKPDEAQFSPLPITTDSIAIQLLADTTSVISQLKTEFTQNVNAVLPAAKLKQGAEKKLSAVIQKAVRPSDPDEDADSALYVGIMALIGAICGFLIVSNPGEWIYFGIILFICAPFEALIAIICGLVTLDKTKELPKNYIPGRRMAAIGIVLGLIAGAMLLAFFNANPGFFG